LCEQKWVESWREVWEVCGRAKCYLNGVKGSGCDPSVDCPLCSLEVLRRTIINVRIGGALFWMAPLVWDEHRLRVFQNRVLRKIFGHKMDEVMEE